ncbi:tape measure protein [Candidatus Poribacteria bacterium]|nr:tape measure protein [Candidatus Poribacteria bacterium]MYK93534.1 tape measure protein [Candidatus Poribacteria bacterium]
MPVSLSVNCFRQGRGLIPSHLALLLYHFPPLLSKKKMPNTLLTFEVEDRRARAAFSRLKREVDSLENEFNTTRSEAREAGAAIDALGDRSRTTARDVNRLGDQAQQSATQIDRLENTAHRTTATWRDTNRQLRDARGRFTSAGQGADIFANSVGGVRGVLTGLGAALAAREIFEFGVASVRSAGQMEGLLRGLRSIEGSQADARLRDFNEIAKLPGLNTPQIIRYSNSLRAAGATTLEVDAIITTFGQSIVGLGGNAADTSRAMLQLTQAFGENKISQENFSTIKELIPSFNRLAKEVYNTDGSMDALNKRFQASGQTLGQFLLPILARLRQEIPAAPVDSYARSVDALQEEFNQLQIAIGDRLLPVVSGAARGFAELFDNITKFIQGTNDAQISVEGFTTALNTATAADTVNKAFEDRIAFLEQEKTALEAAAAGRANYFRFRGRDTEAGRQYKEITTELQRLQAAQGNVAAQSEYLRNVQNGLVTQARTLNTEIAALASEIDGRTGKSVQGLNRQLSAKRTALKEVQTQLATNANALRALAAANTSTAQSTEQATTNAENFSLTLAKLRANAEDTRNALNISSNPQQLAGGFQAALAASNAYYNARIANAQNALAQETAGTEAYNTLQTRIFELGRQRLQADRQITAENQRLLQQLSQERVDAANAVSTAEVEGFQAAAQAGQAYTDQLRRQIEAIPNISSPDAQYGNFTSQLRRDFEETERQGHNLLAVMRQIANAAFATDLDIRIPDPIVRGAAIDERIAEEARGQQTLTDIRQAAGEQGRQFLNRVLRSEERDIQRSITARARQYRQFSSLVSNTFLDLATGRTQSFESVATAFIQQSLRIVLRAVLENQILKRLDDTLTVSRIANINKIAAAQQASLALPGVGNIPGLANIGSSLSGGGVALGAASLLFPEQVKNLAGGISDTIGNLLSNVASAPDRAFGAQQVFLKIGENQIREITDEQDSLREEARV